MTLRWAVKLVFGYDESESHAGEVLLDSDQIQVRNGTTGAVGVAGRVEADDELHAVEVGFVLNVSELQNLDVMGCRTDKRTATSHELSVEGGFVEIPSSRGLQFCTIVTRFESSSCS